VSQASQPANDGVEDLGRPRRQLSLFDTTAIIVGIIIGSGLYESSPFIASNVSDQLQLLNVWIFGGIFALIGSLCYAELATTYPAEGGDYVYLTRGFGRPMGFLFAWVQLWIVRPGAVGAMAYVFGKYATQLRSLGEHSLLIYAVAALIILATVNILGVQLGKWTQNVLTSAKVLGLLTIVTVGLFLVAPIDVEPIKPAGGGGFKLALILVLFTYGGWAEMSYVAAEVRNPEKNIVRALVLGTCSVAAIYVMVNISFTHALGFQGMRDSPAVCGRRGKPGARRLGSPRHQLVDLHLCVGRDQWHDLHRGQNLFGPGKRSSVVRHPGTMEPTFRDADCGRLSGNHGHDRAGHGRGNHQRRQRKSQRVRAACHFHGAGVLVVLDADGHRLDRAANSRW